MGGKRDTTAEERSEVVRFLYDRAHEGKLPSGAIGAAAVRFNLRRNSVSAYWKNRADLTNKKKGNVGRKTVHTIEEVEKKMRDTPAIERQTIVATAKAVGVSKSTFGRMVKRKAVVRRSTSIKPELKNRTKKARLGHVLKFVVPGI